MPCGGASDPPASSSGGRFPARSASILFCMFFWEGGLAPAPRAARQLGLVLEIAPILAGVCVLPPGSVADFRPYESPWLRFLQCARRISPPGRKLCLSVPLCLVCHCSAATLMKSTGKKPERLLFSRCSVRVRVVIIAALCLLCFW
uniref:Uncharacterized protein n=1 Tax=Hordeum vulgare subsp. vulgare TaxID=112509 RepID=A0A8I6YI92_HORVV